MGACYVEKAFAACTEAELRKLVADAIDDAKHEYGHGGYTGSWAEARGVQIDPRSFKSRDEATNYLNDRAEKWGPALAVKVAKVTDWATTPEYRRLLADAEKLAKTVNDMPALIVARWREAKSKTRGCKTCGSAIAVAHYKLPPGRRELWAPSINDTEDPRVSKFEGQSCRITHIAMSFTRVVLPCPVCGQNLGATEADDKALGTAAGRFADLLVAAYEARKKHYEAATSNDWYWLAGAVCSS